LQKVLGLPQFSKEKRGRMSILRYKWDRLKGFECTEIREDLGENAEGGRGGERTLVIMGAQRVVLLVGGPLWWAGRTDGG